MRKKKSYVHMCIFMPPIIIIILLNLFVSENLKQKLSFHP